MCNSCEKISFLSLHIEMMRYALFEKYPALFALSTEREGGVSKGNYASLNMCDYTGDNPLSVETNRQIFCEKHRIARERLFMPHQTHGNRVSVLDEPFLQLSPALQRERLHGVDALVTDRKNVCIGISTADCVPLLLFDPVQEVVAAVHAGWRGTLAKIVTSTVETMSICFGSLPTHLLVQIAPCISVENYEVGRDLYELFRQKGFPVEQLFFEKNNGKFHFDLKAANRFLLLEAGVLPDRIAVSECCTFRDSDRFFSARKLGIDSGRMFSCMMLRQER